MPSATPEPGNNKANVIALGGNAILSDGDSGDVAQQMRSMELACLHLVPLFSSGNGVVITHGNGLQVDNLLVQQVLDKILCGEGIQRDVVTLVSHFVVVEGDPDFCLTSKPIGPFWDAPSKKKYEEHGHTVMEVRPNNDKPFRRSLRALVNQGAIVIAVGAGGILVILEPNGS